MSHSQSILERLRWKVGLGLVVVAAAAAAHPAPAGHDTTNVARSSWSQPEQARSSWGTSVDVARSSWSVLELTADAA